MCGGVFVAPRQHQRLATQLAHAHLEGDARPGRRALEDQRQHAVLVHRAQHVAAQVAQLFLIDHAEAAVDEGLVEPGLLDRNFAVHQQLIFLQFIDKCLGTRTRLFEIFAEFQDILGGIGRLEGKPVVVIGQQKGRDTKERALRNFGMSRPEGYRKAMRLMRLAEKFGLPVFTFVDTPGAFPGIDAEERSQSEAIGRNIWSPTLLKYSDYREEDVIPVARDVIAKMKKEMSSSTNLVSLRKKYWSSKLHKVASISLPSEI